jgi:hypothetical protein
LFVTFINWKIKVDGPVLRARARETEHTTGSTRFPFFFFSLQSSASCKNRSRLERTTSKRKMMTI